MLKKVLNNSCFLNPPPLEIRRNLVEKILHKDYLKGFLLTALGVIILSFDALFIRLIDASSGSILFWRGILLSGVVAIACKWLYPQQALFRSDLRYLRSSLLFGISSICFVMAINLTSVASVLVIISVQPLFAAVLSRVFLGEKSPAVTWIAICIALLGILWVLGNSWQGPHLKGNLLALLCALALSGKFVNDRAETQHSMIPALIGGGLMMSVFAVFSTESIMLTGVAQWGWTLVLCLIIVPLAFVLITLGPKRLPAAEVSMLMLLETVIGPLWIWLFLQITPDTSALQGGSLVIATLVIHSLIRARKTRPAIALSQ